MLSKEEFKKYVKDYLKFSDLLDELEHYYIQFWELDSVGRVLDSYVQMLNKLMYPELPEDRDYDSELEKFLYEDIVGSDLTDEELDAEIDKLYDRIRHSHFYSVEDDEEEEPSDEDIKQFEAIFGFNLDDLDKMLNIRW